MIRSYSSIRRPQHSVETSQVESEYKLHENVKLENTSFAFALCKFAQIALENGQNYLLVSIAPISAEVIDAQTGVLEMWLCVSESIWFLGLQC